MCFLDVQTDENKQYEPMSIAQIGLNSPLKKAQRLLKAKKFHSGQSQTLIIPLPLQKKNQHTKKAFLKNQWSVASNR